MKDKIVAANFKMNKTDEDNRKYFAGFLNALNGIKGGNSSDTDTELIFAPPFTSLCSTQKIIESYKNFIKLSAQNAYFEKSGAFTGEISIDMLKSCGCSYAIIGHSERRNIFKESNELIGRKIEALYKDGGIAPILCVGENLETRNKNEQEIFVEKQLEIALSPLKGEKFESLIIAYEPVWAIGTGMPIKAEDGEAMHAYIRKYIGGSFSVSDLKIIYGGSVTESNIESLINMPDIDGVLVGGASLDVKTFYNIFKSVANV